MDWTRVGLSTIGIVADCEFSAQTITCGDGEDIGSSGCISGGVLTLTVSGDVLLLTTELGILAAVLSVTEGSVEVCDFVTEADVFDLVGATGSGT